MSARLTSDLSLGLWVSVPDRHDRPLLECLEPRRRDRTRDATRYLILRGELCVFSTPLLCDHLDRSAASASLVLDVGDVTVIDSTALAILDAANDRWVERGLTIRLANVRKLALCVIGVLGLEHLLAAPEAGDEGAGPNVDRSGNTPVCAAPRREIDCSRPAGARPVPSPVELTIQNREAGQVVEVTPHGCLREEDMPSLKARVDRLIKVREPRELWIDLRDATGDVNFVGPLVEAAAALWSIGATLVVRHPSPELRRSLPQAADGMVIELERA